MDQMDVDSPTALPSSSSKRVDFFPISSSPSKRIKIALPDSQMVALNEELNGLFPSSFQIKDSRIWSVLMMVLVQELHRTDMRDSFITPPEAKRAEEIIASFNDDELKQWTDGLRTCVETKDWASLLEHPKLKITSPEGSKAQDVVNPQRATEDEKATQVSWERAYQGEAADALWAHVLEHYAPRNTNVYAPFCSIIQSSGMGKSRTVDELGKSHFSIPINLRDATSTGYPPADHEVRKFLTREGTKADADLRASCFIEALLRHTSATLKSFGSVSGIEQLASQFRTSMTKGQTTKQHNDFRRNFYDRVVQMAGELMKDGVRLLSLEYNSSPKVSHKNCFSPRAGDNFDSPIFSACHELGDFLKQSDPKAEDCSLVILAFDEAHTLTRRKGEAKQEWSNFNALRYVLCTLRHFPLFSLFISTTSEILQSISPSEDPLRRIAANHLMLTEPFTDLDFDMLASENRVSVDGHWDLETVLNDSHMTRLGRPLYANRISCFRNLQYAYQVCALRFGSRYDAGDRTMEIDIVNFAIDKLLNINKRRDFSLDQSLACLSQRLPIEFMSTGYISQAERKQVEGHLRVCLKIDAAFESMTTITPSEPLLSEAAYTIMARRWIDPLKAFKSILEDFPIYKGDRGEFLVLLLLTLARDLAVGRPDKYGRPHTGQRSFKFSSFLHGHLFKPSTETSALNSLHQDFPGAVMHFNHFVKLRDFKSIDKECLLLLMTRGAGVLCANNQPAIDGANVFLISGTQITTSNLGIVLWQVKNDDRYTDEPKPAAFEPMDPFKLEILKSGDTAVPVIRIFFALASEKSSFHVTRHEPSPVYQALRYDIWIAGLSPDLLKPIDPENVNIWEDILQASCGWKEHYKANTHLKENLRRSRNPGAADDSSHWSRWARESSN